MSIRNNILNGVDWSDGEILTAEDLNDTFNELEIYIKTID